MFNCLGNINPRQPNLFSSSLKLKKTLYFPNPVPTKSSTTFKRVPQRPQNPAATLGSTVEPNKCLQQQSRVIQRVQVSGVGSETGCSATAEFINSFGSPPEASQYCQTSYV